MVTVASPKAGAAEISWRADQVRTALAAVRAKAPAGGRRTAGILAFPVSVSPVVPRQVRDLFIEYAKDNKRGKDMRPIEGAGFVGVDGDFGDDDASISAFGEKFQKERLRPSEIHPDVWPLAYVQDPAQTEARLGGCRRRQIQPEGNGHLHGTDPADRSVGRGSFEDKPVWCSERADFP